MFTKTINSIFYIILTLGQICLDITHSIFSGQLFCFYMPNILPSFDNRLPLSSGE